MQAHAVKRSRLVWTPQLHRRFEEAVEQLGVDKCVPKTIMAIMRVDGLTRENVASHLQKYRLQIKQRQSEEDRRRRRAAAAARAAEAKARAAAEKAGTQRPAAPEAMEADSAGSGPAGPAAEPGADEGAPG